MPPRQGPPIGADPWRLKGATRTWLVSEQRSPRPARRPVQGGWNSSHSCAAAGQVSGLFRKRHHRPRACQQVKVVSEVLFPAS